MRTSLLFCLGALFFYTSNLLQAQSPASYQKGFMDFYVSPFTVMEPSSTLSIGLEYFLKEDLSIHTDLGYVFSHLNIAPEDDLGNINTEGASLAKDHLNIVFKPEIRWYKHNELQDAFYYGLRLNFRNLNFNKAQVVFEEYAYNTATDSWTGIGNQVVDMYRTRRQTIGAQFLIGWKAPIFRRGIQNPYLGLGIRYISNKPIDKAFNPFNNDFSFLEGIEFYSFRKQYKFVMMDIAMGIRFGGGVKRK